MFRQATLLWCSAALYEVRKTEIAMSRTLFFYIFKDLVRIFLMASGALAGIMSFGGLLKPLTREGLDAGQVTRMLAYFGPAMTTYSFPVAALFATAVVYGRLAADNELTACKGSGISLLSLTVSGPALVLGLIVAIASLLFLCFVVPASTLRVEKVIYSNLAKLVQGRIERTHEIEFEDTTIFAQSARVIPPDDDNPNLQRVELIGPEIISVDRDPVDRKLYTPREFYTASRAFVFIEPRGDGQFIDVTVHFHGAFKFPRRYVGATEAGVASTQYGPMRIPSPIKEEVKFMNIFKLQEMYEDLGSSRKLRPMLSEFLVNEQKEAFLLKVANGLNSQSHFTKFDFGKDGSYSAEMDGGYAAMLNGHVYFPYRLPEKQPETEPASSASTLPTSNPATEPSRPIVYREERDGRRLTIRAASAVISATPLLESNVFAVNVELADCLHVNNDKDLTGLTQKKFTSATFNVPMTPAEREMASHGLDYFEKPENSRFGNQSILAHEKTVLINNIIAESNNRASFAISCLILVMAGSALGMMFRSGNFLTAFAVSFIPAMLCITLIVAGQRTAGNVPLGSTGKESLRVGLSLIWTGNAINLLLAIGLLWKLGRR